MKLRALKRMVATAVLCLGATVISGHWALAADKGEIVVFIPSSTNPYIGQFEKGAKDKARCARLFDQGDREQLQPVGAG